MGAENPGPSAPTWPEEPRLAEVARSLGRTRTSAILCDSEWRLVWASDELKKLFGVWDEEQLGYGRHVIEVYTSDTWSVMVTDESQMRFFVEEFPLLAHDTPGGREGLVDALLVAAEKSAELPSWTHGVTPTREIVESLMRAVDPIEPPPVYTSYFDFLQGDLPPLRVIETMVRLRDENGEFFGTLITYQPGLSAPVLTLVSRGDEDMFERMTRLVEPRRRRAAILFADLQDSSVLSRKLPSAAYFKLICAITTAADEVIARRRGIVGKHVGDGSTAFFLTEDLGSPSGACRAAIEAARDIIVAARDAAKSVGEETGLIGADDCLVNAGIHWGGTLYMGQLVTGGRLEVTALGDEVNEAARIQESARDGNVLSSKVLIEHLEDDDARSLGIDQHRVLYRPIADLPSATPKAKRDAGGIPVATI
ncbi:MAG: adenylate/guanylate cyclase domain-containing protein [Actinomycetota bacterium]|nr:adenylate/guanylate cyclase domain-containing protein [Actinomycetota bacterium]